MLPILTVRNLSTGYGKKQVLFNVSLDVMPGEILLITGGNGSGKPSPRDAGGSGRQSTLLKAIDGLLPVWNTDAETVFRPNPMARHSAPDRQRSTCPKVSPAPRRKVQRPRTSMPAEA